MSRALDIPISAVIATRNRSASLHRTLESLANQSAQPVEIILVDSSDDDVTKAMCESGMIPLGCDLKWVKARQAGAAVQRNEGISLAAQPYIWFFDDDILFEPDCVERLWKAISSERQLGGVNAMIVNQRYQPPGFISRTMFTIMNGGSEKSFAGRVMGPAVNLLPEDREDLPEVVPVEWLNTTCTIYRREAMPHPPFPSNFTGYSLMEDLALSLVVGKKWKLANARTARIFHDSQPGDYKSHQHSLNRMEFFNRYFVMTRMLGKRGFADYAKLLLWELFSLASSASKPGNWSRLPSIISGKLRGLIAITRDSG